MPAEYDRVTRLADRLVRELNILLCHKLRNPKLTGVSVVGVRLSRDCATATVYVNYFTPQHLDAHPSADEPAQIIRCIQRAGGFLRKCLAHNLNMRVTPKLRFIYDPHAINRYRLFNS